MPPLSPASLSRLATCHPDLRDVLVEVSKTWSFAVLEGHRGQEAQDKAFSEGKSKLRWPNGKHNALPSLAVDVAPLPIDWQDREKFSYFAGFMLGTAASMGILLRWGGDWGMKMDLKGNQFDDLVHYELIVPPPAPRPQVIA